jgi:C4-dicarboxylate-specific signal transduction histidine kinase
MKLENRPKEKTELNSLIEETVAVIRGEARKQSTNIFLHILNEPIYIFADRIQIQQVLLNFIINASQSIERDGASKKTIDINQTFKEENVIISVRDYGRGIDESIKDVVFKPFVTSKIEGMGIGLAICRSIIEDHNGKIWAENKKDGGAEFSFSLKIFKDE